MTAPLNKARDCCDSEVEGQMAGLTVSYAEDVLVAVPAILNTAKNFGHLHLLFC